jgi:hypothetical protein
MMSLEANHHCRETFRARQTGASFFGACIYCRWQGFRKFPSRLITCVYIGAYILVHPCSEERDITLKSLASALIQEEGNADTLGGSALQERVFASTETSSTQIPDSSSFMMTHRYLCSRLLIHLAVVLLVADDDDDDENDVPDCPTSNVGYAQLFRI